MALCGHATLASAYVLFYCLDYKADMILFDSLSGGLKVWKDLGRLTMEFPADIPQSCKAPEESIIDLGKPPIECYEAQDYVAIYSSQDEIKSIQPDFSQLEQLALRGVIVTAPSDSQDFVVRFFAPKYGIQEDPVTGSAYTALTPYWSGKLGKTEFEARQISSRGGNVYCRLQNERVLISGNAVKYMEGVAEIKI